MRFQPTQKAARLKRPVMSLIQMQKILIITLLFIVSSCSSHYDAENLDTESILSVSVNVLQKHKGTRGTIYQEDWPPLFEKIGAKSVFVRDDGLYIVLSSFFIEEKGLFVPREGVNVVVGTGFDPSYKEIKDGLYSYIIKS